MKRRIAYLQLGFFIGAGAVATAWLFTQEWHLTALLVGGITFALLTISAVVTDDKIRLK